MDKYSSIVFFEVCQNKNFGIRSRHQVNVKGFFWQSISSKQFLTNQSRTYTVLDTPHRREEGWLEHNTRVSLSPGEQITRITVAASLPVQLKQKRQILLPGRFCLTQARLLFSRMVMSSRSCCVQPSEHAAVKFGIRKCCLCKKLQISGMAAACG